MTRRSTLSAILNKEPKPVSDTKADLPSDLEKLIKRCLRKEPECRFQHMADTKVALEELKLELASRTGQAIGAEQTSVRGKQDKESLSTVGF